MLSDDEVSAIVGSWGEAEHKAFSDWLLARMKRSPFPTERSAEAEANLHREYVETVYLKSSRPQ